MNQQRAIAAAITAELLATANLDARDVCKLTHETLHRIARLAPVQWTEALSGAIRKRTGSIAPDTVRNGGRTEASDAADAWTSFWERGGFHVHIRKPLRDVEPAKAKKYLDDLLPGICGLAIRAAEAGDDSEPAAFGCEAEQGRLLFLPPVRTLTPTRRDAAREMLARLVAELSAAI